LVIGLQNKKNILKTNYQGSFLYKKAKNLFNPKAKEVLKIPLHFRGVSAC